MHGKLICGAGAVCVLLAGCGVQGDEYQPRRVPAEKSVVYLYRPFKVLGSSATPLVTCGHESIEMEPGGYYSFDEEPDRSRAPQPARNTSSTRAPASGTSSVKTSIQSRKGAPPISS